MNEKRPARAALLATTAFRGACADLEPLQGEAAELPGGRMFRRSVSH